MVDCALLAIKELMEDHPECLLYGQDVGKRLGGVFREAATLADTFGDNRVFNTPIQEAFIIGSTVGMSAVGSKPIVEFLRLPLNCQRWVFLIQIEIEQA